MQFPFSMQHVLQELCVVAKRIKEMRKYTLIILLSAQQQITIIRNWKLKMAIITMICKWFLPFSLSILLSPPVLPVCDQFRVKRKSSSSPSPRPKKRKKKKSGRRRSRWVEAASADEVVRFFSFVCKHADRIITLWFCETEFQLFWCECCKRAVRQCKRWGRERLAKHRLIFQFRFDKVSKRRENERKEDTGVKERKRKGERRGDE